MTHLARLAAVLLLLATVSFAAAPPPALDARRAGRLIVLLGNRDPRVRDLAQRRLAALGPAVLPSLYPAVTHPDPEVRRRVLRLIGPLEQERDLRPRRFTGSFRDAPLAKVLAEVRAQTGNRVRLVEGPEVGVNPLKLKAPPRFTGSFVDATFWEVMQQVCDGCKLRLLDGNSQGPVGELFVVPVRTPPAFVVTDGAFRVTANRIEQHRGLDLDGDDTSDPVPTINVTISVQCEPRLRFVATGEPHLESAYDDRGRSLLPPREAASEESEDGPLTFHEVPARGGGGHTASFQVSLVRVSADASRIRVLKGVLPATVVVGYQSRVLLDKVPTAKGRTFKVGPMSYRVEQVRSLGRGRLEVRLRPQAGPMMGGLDMTGPLSNGLPDLEMRDEAGERCPHQPSDAGAADEDLIVLQVGPSRKGRKPAVQLVVREPRLREVSVPFTIRNVPLP